MKMLLAGDVVGNPGRRAMAWTVSRMKSAGEIDIAVVNAENAAGGRGLSVALARELLDAGADVITLGDHAWDQRDLASGIEIEPRILRPANFTPACPGRGWLVFDSAWGRVAVINLVGRVFMTPADCPFRTADAVLKSTADARFSVVDFHAEATSEKIALGHYLDGRVGAVAGTHTHVQTADETILPRGTAYITDLGMTGPRRSVLGRDIDSVLKRFVTGMPAKFDIASEDVALEGLIVDFDDATGRARAVRRVRAALPDSS